MKTIYHVAPENHEGNIVSLYSLHGDDAYDIYSTRWPEAGDLGQYHVHYVHCYDNVEDAKEHAGIYGGKIYEIDVEAMENDFFEIEIDNLEFAHPMVRDEIPAEYVRIVE